MKYEICIDSVMSALVAQEAGADRVELCANLLEGGTTPSYGTIKQTRAKINIGLQVIIRPRGGDFLFSKIEQETIIDEIRIAKELGADGAVVGALNAEGGIDLDFLEMMMEVAWPLNVTFHRAFDMCRDPKTALNQLRIMGVNRILTSGQKADAWTGSEYISKMVKQAKDSIIIMPGGGIDESNIAQVVKKTGVKEIHFSGRDWVKSKMNFCREGISMGNPDCSDEFRWKMANVKRIRGLMALLD